METYAVDPGPWWIGRAFGRNPLLRFSDRVEALVITVAVAVALIALPVVAVVGVGVYDAHHRTAAEQARTRHPVTATVTGADSADPSNVQVTWRTATGERAGAVRWNQPVRVGEHVDIWVDDQGNQVAPPMPASGAVIDAGLSALAIFVIVAIAMGSLVAVARIRLGRTRDAGWEREIRRLQDDDGGRKNPH